MAEERVGALTTRDLGELSTSSSNLDMFATRGFQDFLVTLPDEPDFPFELSHSLSPALPTGVRYEVLQATFPTVLYHNPEDLWGVGYVVLRATAGDGAQIRVRLTVDDGDANPIQEASDLSVTHGFQVPDKLGSLSTNPTADDSATGLDFGAGFSYASNASHYGPSVELGDDASGMGWHVSADMFGYSVGRHAIRWIPKTESSTYRYAMQLSQATSPVAAEYYLTGGPTASNKLYLGAPTGPFGSSRRIEGGYFFDLNVSNGVIERGRSVAMGEWTDITYNAGNFTAGGAMTWGVDVFDIGTLKYAVIGKSLLLNFYIAATTTAGVAAPDLRITLPNSYIIANTMLGAGGVYNTSALTHEPLITYGAAGDSYVSLYRKGNANWPLEVNTIGVFGQVIVPIQ
jgi:hypothetical protein